MDSTITVIFCVTAYKLGTLLAGTLFCYMGYRLFYITVAPSKSQFTAKAEGVSLALNSTAPGLFFSLFGAAIVCFTIYKGLDFDLSKRMAAENNTAVKPMASETVRIDADKAAPPLPDLTETETQARSIQSAPLPQSTWQNDNRPGGQNESIFHGSGSSAPGVRPTPSDTH